jgi:hypothetical protein
MSAGDEPSTVTVDAEFGFELQVCQWAERH